jgi:hypothetical protein
MDKQRCEGIGVPGVRCCSRVRLPLPLLAGVVVVVVVVVEIRLEDSLQCAVDQAGHAIYRGRTNQQIPDRSSQGDDGWAELDDDLVVVRDGEVRRDEGGVHQRGRGKVVGLDIDITFGG